VLIDLEPHLLGKWVEGCGVTFFIPNLQVLLTIHGAMENFVTLIQAAWSEAKNYCCKLGMSLVTFYSSEKQICTFDALNSIKSPFYLLKKLFFFISGSVSYGQQFWTSATDQYCPGKFRFLILLEIKMLKLNLII